MKLLFGTLYFSAEKGKSFYGRPLILTTGIVRARYVKVMIEVYERK